MYQEETNLIRGAIERRNKITIPSGQSLMTIYSRHCLLTVPIKTTEKTHKTMPVFSHSDACRAELCNSYATAGIEHRYWRGVQGQLVTVATVNNGSITKFSFASQIRDVCKDLILSDETLRMVMQKLNDEMNKGLTKATHDQAVVKCFPTYVQDLPNGTGKRRTPAHHS